MQPKMKRFPTHSTLRARTTTLTQCGFAYVIALCINQIGGAFTGNLNVIGLIVSVLLIAGMLFMLFKPYKEANKLTKKVKIK